MLGPKMSTFTKISKSDMMSVNASPELQLQNIMREFPFYISSQGKFHIHCLPWQKRSSDNLKWMAAWQSRETVGFEVFVLVTMKSTVFCAVTLHSLERSQRFSGKYCLHLHQAQLAFSKLNGATTHKSKLLLGKKFKACTCSLCKQTTTRCNNTRLNWRLNCS
jgi:hypothetical protein